MTTKKVVLWALGILVSVPCLALAYVQVRQEVHVRWRQPINLDCTVRDSAGAPISHASFAFEEKGWRYLVPIPFVHQWMSSPKKHTYTTDEKGRFVASFHDQFFELVQIQGAAAASVKYLAVFTRWDGNTYQTQHMQEQWGFYDRAQDPYARKWTIILPEQNVPHQSSGRG